MQEKIFLDSESGKVCCLHNKIEGSDAVAILGHGYISDKESRTNTELSKKLNEMGISTISYDMYGHGESEGDIERLTVSKAVQNVVAVYDFAKSKGYSKIGISGSSFTGIVSLIAATQREFTVLTLKCPVFDSKLLWDGRLGEEGVEKWKKDGYIRPFGKRWSYEAYEDASKYNMKELAPKIQAPVLVIHGDKDETVPIKHAENIIAYVSSKDKKLIVVEGADHFFHDQTHFNKMIEESSKWFKRHLKEL